MVGEAALAGVIDPDVASAAGCFADVFGRLFAAFSCEGVAACSDVARARAGVRRVSEVAVVQALVAAGVVPALLDAGAAARVVRDAQWTLVPAAGDDADARSAGLCASGLVEAFTRAIFSSPLSRAAQLLMGLSAGASDGGGALEEPMPEHAAAFLFARGVHSRAQLVYACLAALFDAGGTCVGLPPRQPAPVSPGDLGAHFVAAAVITGSGTGAEDVEPTWSLEQLRGFCERYGVVGGALPAARLGVLVADCAATSAAPPGRLDGADFSALLSRAAAARFPFAPVPDSELRRVIAARGLGPSTRPAGRAALCEAPQWCTGDAGMFVLCALAAASAPGQALACSEWSS